MKNKSTTFRTLPGDPVYEAHVPIDKIEAVLAAAMAFAMLAGDVGRGHFCRRGPYPPSSATRFDVLFTRLRWFREEVTVRRSSLPAEAENRKFDIRIARELDGSEVTVVQRISTSHARPVDDRDAGRPASASSERIIDRHDWSGQLSQRFGVPKFNHGSAHEYLVWYE